MKSDRRLQQQCFQAIYVKRVSIFKQKFFAKSYDLINIHVTRSLSIYSRLTRPLLRRRYGVVPAQDPLLRPRHVDHLHLGGRGQALGRAPRPGAPGRYHRPGDLPPLPLLQHLVLGLVDVLDLGLLDLGAAGLPLVELFLELVLLLFF